MNKSRISVGLLALAALATSSLAIGAVGTLRVPTRDLNLANPADVQVLYARLQEASASVCGKVDARNIVKYHAWEQCYQRTLRDAVKQINDPVLLALHQRAISGTPAG